MRDDFVQFIQQFKSISGIDLSHYNPAQIQRRLIVLQQKFQLKTYEELLAAIKDDENLFQECLKRLTINVTEFYRDFQYWDKLKIYISHLTRIHLPLRLWSAGCATGEEAYSLSAMLVAMIPRDSWKLLASDLDSQALATAQAGLYKEKSLKELSERQVATIFNKVEDDLYTVKGRVRDKVNFFKHNLLQDEYPPNLDVILCRNVLIYFKESAKKQVIAQLAQVLNPGGVLFIGGSEQIINADDYNLRNENIYFYIKQ